MHIPKEPFKFLLEITLFNLLLVPYILWAILKKILPTKQKSVRGQVVLITGAARGIGRELALTFHKLGAKVACVDIDETGNNETAQIIKDDGGVAGRYKCDISNRDEIKVLYGRVKDDLGLVDILINNAGIVWGHMYSDPKKDQFIINQMNVNLMGQFWMNREILPLMMERNSGHIVAISSMSSLFGLPGLTTYTISKCGINGMMECLHNELRSFNSNVKTTNILPYFVQTNPKVTAQLNLRTPEIPLDIACKVIVKGILEEKREFSVPEYIYPMYQLIRLLPDNAQTLFNRIFYISVLPESIINKYKRK